MKNWLFPCLKLVALVFIAGQLCACALGEKENRRLLNKLDESFQPKSTAARVSCAPLTVVGGNVALAIDGVVINPVAVVPKAWDDTYELYWKPREADILRKSLMFPIITVLTPPTFVGDWAMRAAIIGND